MKRVVLFVILSLYSLNLLGQAQVDTLYYDKDWKQAIHPAFAEYYRVMYCSTDGSTKQFRDYYITGQLQSAGNFIHIDPSDDSKSVFTGKVTFYRRNGEQEKYMTYRNGVLHGQFCEYNDNGSVLRKGQYWDGKLSGMFTEFLVGGDYVQIEYDNGAPKYEYYLRGNNSGNVAKYYLSNNTLYMESPNLNEKRVEYRNDCIWQYYIKNGLKISVTTTKVNDYGKYYRIDVIFTNNSMSPIVLDPAHNFNTLIRKSGGSFEYVKTLSADEYLGKVERQQAVASALMSFTEGMANANAGYSTSRTTSNHYGTVNSVYGSNSYYGTTTSSTRTYNYAAARQAQILSRQRMDEFNNELIEERNIKEIGYLKKNTINPGESVSGYVHIKQVKGESLTLYINIGVASYQFDWNL